MNNKKNFPLLILICCGFLASFGSFANTTDYLIREMEELRNSLKPDDPAKIDLTLRLADLYFDASIKEGDKSTEEAMIQSRARALNLYRQSLSGTDGVEKASGATRIKIQFQMARLLTRLNEYEEAELHYKEVEASSHSPRKMKEQASLALAEWYEEDAQYEKAVVFYDKALDFCAERAGCNYAHYRKGWLYFKDTKLDLAINEMKASLWSSETQVRESSLQDLILFMSNNDTNGEVELGYIRKLATKLERPELVGMLVEAFYVAGNRRAGSHLLAYINGERPNLYYEVRLLEEFYGFRNWDKVDQYLKELAGRSSQDIPSKKEEAQEVNKILRRYLVQVDSEAEVISELTDFLKRSIDVYLGIYPNDDLRTKLQQGWLKAETDDAKKVARLGLWIAEDTSYGVAPEQVRKLRQTRLSLAQKLKNSDVVLAESLAIAAILKGTKEADEFEYVAAREHYGRKEFDQALPLFQALVERAIATKKFDQWSILAQNLVLDIHNNQKNYSAIVAQVEVWREATAGEQNKDLLRENKNMEQIRIEARFEEALQMSDGPLSLLAFFNFCFEGIYSDKSCPNAKVLAVKFGDQQKLVRLLEREGDEKALMTEYERMGRFSEAAKLQEKLVLPALKGELDYESYLKVALLYELDQNFSERNRILKRVITLMKKEKEIPSEIEGALFLTLDEAGLIDTKALFLPWSLNRKLALATRLELEKPGATTQKLILGQGQSTGPVWSKLILGKIQRQFAGVSKVKFYGRNSERLFKRRTRAIDQFVSEVRPLLEGADLETRIYLLDMLERTYAQMTEDILATPIPEGLDDQTMAQVQVQLQTIMAPFEEVRADYENLKNDQLASYDLTKPEQLASQERVSANLELGEMTYDQFISTPTRVETALINDAFVEVRQYQEGLLVAPGDTAQLGKLKDYFEEKKMLRLAAYYSDRIESLKN